MAHPPELYTATMGLYADLRRAMEAELVAGGLVGTGAPHRMLTSALALLRLDPGRVLLAEWTDQGEPAWCEARGPGDLAGELGARRRAALGRRQVTLLGHAQRLPGSEIVRLMPPVEQPPPGAAEAEWVMVTGYTPDGHVVRLTLSLAGGRDLVYMCDVAAEGIPRWDVQDMGAVDTFARELVLAAARSRFPDGDLQQRRLWLSAPHGADPRAMPRAWVFDPETRGDAAWLVTIERLNAALVTTDDPRLVSAIVKDPETVRGPRRSYELRLNPVVPGRRSVAAMADLVLLAPAGAPIGADVLDVTRSATMDAAQWVAQAQTAAEA